MIIIVCTLTLVELFTMVRLKKWLLLCVHLHLLSCLQWSDRRNDYYCVYTYTCWAVHNGKTEEMIIIACTLTLVELFTMVRLKKWLLLRVHLHLLSCSQWSDQRNDYYCVYTYTCWAVHNGQAKQSEYTISYKPIVIHEVSSVLLVSGQIRSWGALTKLSLLSVPF